MPPEPFILGLPPKQTPSYKYIEALIYLWLTDNWELIKTSHQVAVQQIHHRINDVCDLCGGVCHELKLRPLSPNILNSPCGRIQYAEGNSKGKIDALDISTPFERKHLITITSTYNINLTTIDISLLYAWPGCLTQSLNIASQNASLATLCGKVLPTDYTVRSQRASISII